MADNPRNVDTNIFLRSNYAPSPEEETRITVLLAKEEQDLARLNELIEECKKNQELSRRDIDVLKMRLSTTQLRMDVASQLLGRVRNGLENTRKAEVTQYLPSTSSSGEGNNESIYHRQGLNHIRQIYETIVHGTLKHMEDIEALIKREARTVALVQKELQGSLFVERTGQMTLESIVEAREMLLKSINSKKNLFRPISRVPPEIWTEIFRETAFEAPDMTTEFDWHTSSKPWRQSFTLSAVCYQWRMICQADTMMWRNVVVVFQDDEHGFVSDPSTHCSLSKGMLESLTLVTRHISFSEPYTLLQE